MRIQIALFLGVLALMVRLASAQTELMVNGGFESGTLAPWVVQGSPTAVLSAKGAHSGSQCALLANGNYYSQNVYQTITFPTNLIAATFSFYLNIASSDTSLIPDAYFSFYITDINQNVLVNLGQASDLNVTGGYVQFTTNLVTYTGAPNLSYAGTTVQVHFTSETDGYGSLTQFYLDDVSMQVATTANIPANDDFTNLTILNGSPIELFANNTFATKEPGEPNHAGNAGGHSLWWGWVAPSNGIVSLNNAGSSFQTLLAVYTGSVLTNLTPVAAVNNGTLYTMSFKVAAGTEYDIAVDGYNGATGSIVMNLGFAPDVTPPKVSITAPANGANLTNAFFLLQGKASDNVAVAQVQYRLENAAGTNAYQAAIGTTNWSVFVTGLIPGANTVRVRAFDTSSNVSPAVACTVNYLVGQPLTLSINGSGTVSGATNGQFLHVGVAYKITALPKTGFGFAGWTGDVVSNAPALTFVMQTNLTLQANFVDITRPTLSITNPAKTGARWSNEVFTVSGKCADNVAVSNVWVSWNSGAWLAAGLSNRGSNWSETITVLNPGTNSFAAYAVDTSGNVSLTNTTKLIYVLSATLTVGTNGEGGITPAYNGKTLQISNIYTMTAKPDKGFGFVNWTDGLGDIITNGAILKFVMASNLTLVANFADITPPTLSITNPAKTGEQWSNLVFTVSGKSGDNVAVSNVFVSLNSAAWTPATLSNGGSNWTEQVSLMAGTNTIAAYAVDTSGLNSKPVTVTVVRALVPAEFLIYQNNSFHNPQGEIAFDGTNYLVAFQTELSGSGIPTAQLVSPSGALAAPLLQIPVSGGADAPQVAFDGTNYLLAWGDPNNQIEGPGIHGQLVDTTGAAVGSQFQITPATTVDNFGTMAFGGGVYFLMWSDSREAGTTGTDDIYGALLAPDGTVAVSDFEISPGGVQAEAGQGTAAFDGTNFLATWGGASGGLSVNGRIISPTGNFVTDPFNIYTNNSVSAGNALNCVVFDGTKYLVLFTVGAGSGSASTWHILGRFVTTMGEVLTNQISLTADAGPQIVPCATFDGTHYLITWNQGFDPFNAASSGSIKARYFDVNGNPTSAEFTLFAPATGQTALWAPVRFDGSQYFSVGGLGQVLTPAPSLKFTNGIINGTFLLP